MIALLSTWIKRHGEKVGRKAMPLGQSITSANARWHSESCFQIAVRIMTRRAWFPATGRPTCCAQQPTRTSGSPRWLSETVNLPTAMIVRSTAEASSLFYGVFASNSRPRLVDTIEMNDCRIHSSWNPDRTMSSLSIRRAVAVHVAVSSTTPRPLGRVDNVRIPQTHL